MSENTPSLPRRPIRDLLRGIGELTEFLREAMLALIEVAVGHWPQPFGELRERRKGPKAPNQGKGPFEKIAPFPADD